MSTIKILHVDGDTLMRNMLKFHFNTQMQSVNQEEKDASRDELRIVTSVANAKQALEACESNEFDLILTDIKLSEMSGYELAKQLLLKKPEQRIIILSAYADLNNINRSFKIGVVGYLSKKNSVERLEEVIHAVLSGATHFEEGALLKIHKGSTKLDSGALLTTVELQLLKLVYLDRTRGEIARQLNYAERTIDAFIVKLKKKLGVRSKIGLAVYAEHHQLF